MITNVLMKKTYFYMIEHLKNKYRFLFNTEMEKVLKFK